MSSDGFLRSVATLAARDPALGAVVERLGPPPRLSRPPTFQTLVLLILEQQVSLDSARAAYDRLAAAVPEVTPAHLLALDDGQLRACGFSRQKGRYARALAARVLEGSLALGALEMLDDDAVREVLTETPGIGPWTADVFLMNALHRPDVWPVGDRALRVGTAELLELPIVPTAEELRVLGERWAPHRSAATHILWHAYLAARGRRMPG